MAAGNKTHHDRKGLPETSETDWRVSRGRSFVQAIGDSQYTQEQGSRPIYLAIEHQQLQLLGNPTLRLTV